MAKPVATHTTLYSDISVDYIDHMGSDIHVVNAARVSFDKHAGRYLKQHNDNLIRYLAKHKHYSPFGHCFASFKVKAPIFVARQLVKHEYLRWNEISRRYVDTEPEIYYPKNWRGKAEDKKQGSISGKDGVVELDHFTNNSLTSCMNDSLHRYRDLLDAGVCPEQARMVLPQATMTEWYWSGSLDAFSNMCNLRLKPDTQEETRVVAEMISYRMGQLFPVSWLALYEP